MKRIATGFCVAAAFGCVATLGAQTSTSADHTRARSAAMTDKARDITSPDVSARAPTANYMLTNAKHGQSGAARTATTGTHGDAADDSTEHDATGAMSPAAAMDV